MLDAQVLQCLSVGLMCWERFAANTLNVSTIFPSEMLAAQVLLVCLHISLFEVLEVLEGERCLDRCVSDYYPSRDVGFLVCLPVGFVVNTVVTSGDSTIL